MLNYIIYARYPSGDYPEGCLEFQGFKGLRKRAVDIFRKEQIPHTLVPAARDCLFTTASRECILGVLQVLSKSYKHLTVVDVDQPVESFND